MRLVKHCGALPEDQKSTEKRIEKEKPLRKASAKRDRLFKKYYLEHRDKIYWYIYRKISRTGEAEDLTADVFMKLYENFHSIGVRGDKGVVAWLYTVARNASIDFLRKNAVRKTRSIEDEELEPVTKVFEDFVGREIKNEELLEIRNALAVVDEVEREIIMLRYEEDMKFKEIATIVGKSEGACKMIFYRSLVKVRDEVTKLREKTA